MRKLKLKRHNEAASAPDAAALFFERMEPRILFSADALSGLVASDPFSDSDTDNAALNTRESASYLKEAYASGPHDADGQLPPFATQSLKLDDLQAAFDNGNSVNDSDRALNSLETLLDGAANQVENRQEIIFVDAATPDYERLLGAVDSNAPGTDYQIFILQSDRDGIAQITEYLGRFEDVDAIHLLSHGNETGLQLGSGWLGQASLDSYADAIGSWSAALAEDADLLIYGCNLAADFSGQQLIGNLSELTGADVAASDDFTGAAALGGDWQLEYTVGDIEGAVAVGTTAQQTWSNVLATFTVTTTDDVLDDFDGLTSLREAIIDANTLAGADEIILGPDTYTLTIGGTNENSALQGDLDINSELTITGAGAGLTIIDGGGLDRVFDVSIGGNATITDLTIQNGGNVAQGGGLYMTGGGGGAQVTLERVIVSNNSATSAGGGIFNDAVLTLNDVEISGNNAPEGGGLYNEQDAALTGVTISGNTADFGAGINNANVGNTLSLTNVTISGNTATNQGGGIFTGNSAELTNSTVAFNTASAGGGIYVSGGQGDALLQNTILASNTGNNANAVLSSSGHNIDSDGTAGLSDPNDQSGTIPSPLDPLLGALADNGGPTPTHALLAGSPAIDPIGLTGAPATDQRGLVRDATPDIGAYEFGVGPTGPTDLETVLSADGGISINEDGGNDAYLLADDGGAIFGGLTSLTIETQFAVSTPAADETTLLSYASSGSAEEVKVIIRSTGQLELHVGGSSQVSAGTYASLFDGQQHHVAVSWDSAAGSVEMYVDGAPVESFSGFRSGYSIDGSGSLLFGQEQNSVGGGFETADLFQGRLYDVRVFNDVRTAGEILASYDSTLPYNESGLVANWTFNDISTSGVVTDTVAGNHLTVQHVGTGGGFTTSNPVLTLVADENSPNGTVVGTVAGTDAERDALIASLLGANPDLSYSAETGKFYEFVLSPMDFSAAQSNALGSTLNGVSGQMAVVESATENQLLADIVTGAGILEAYLGASDASVEGEWRWFSGITEAEQFWAGDWSGNNVDGLYVNWSGGEPNNVAEEDYAAIRDIGSWNDVSATSLLSSIIEYDADAVLSNAGPAGEQPLTYSIQAQTVAGAFTVDANSGEITVADDSLLDYETDPAHTLTVRVTDVDGNTYDEAITIELGDINDAPTATNLSSTSSYNEGDATVPITDIVVSDVDAGEIITATLTLADTATGSLSANDGASYTPGTGVWTITDTVANVNTALANLVFAPNVNNDVDTSIAVSIDDGDEDASGPLTGTITLDVTGVLNGIDVTAPLTDNTLEDTDLVFSVANGNEITVADGTIDDPLLRTTLTVTNGTLTLATTAGLTLVTGDGTGTVILIGSESDINTALDGLTYAPTAGYSGPTDLTVTTDLQADLLGFYEFENNGDLGNDTSPNGTNDGAVFEATQIIDGTRGNVLQLDGIDDAITIPGRFGDPQNLTLAAWVQLDATSGSSEVISLGNRVILRLDDTTSGLGAFGSFYDGSTYLTTSLNTFIAGTGWHHVAYTLDGAANEQTLYIDGLAVDTTTHTNPVVYAGGDPDSTLGSHPTNPGYFLEGEMDDARIYDRALSASEIQALAIDQYSDTETVSITVNPVNNAPSVVPSTVFINELHYDNAGIDTGEAIEIMGVAGTDLSGWSLVLYNGLSSTLYDTVNLSGIIADQSNGYGTAVFSFPVDGIQNDMDGIALVNASSEVVQFISYEGAFTATDGPAAGLTSTDIGVAEDFTTPIGDSLQLTGTGSEMTWMAASASTFGALNTGQNVFAVDNGIEDTDNVYTHAQMLALLGASDRDDADANLTINITNVVNGTLTMSGGAGEFGTTFTFTPDPEFSGQFSFDYQVLDDDAAASAIGNGVINIAAVNDAPVLGNNTLTLDQGDIITIDSSMLSATDDVTASSALVFNLSNIGNGYFAYAADTTTAITSFTQTDVTTGIVRFVHDGGELAPAYEIAVSDGTATSAAAAASVNFTGNANGVLWLSMDGDEGTGSGVPGLDTTDIEDDDVLQQAGPNFSMGDASTDGTFSVAFNASDFAGDQNIDGIHYVTSTVSIGATNAITLQAGDLLMTNDGGATFVSNGAGAPADLDVDGFDVFFFRPDTPGDYSIGNFYMLLSDPFQDGANINGLTLVEKDVVVGDYGLVQGDMLFTRSGGGERNDIWLLETAALDPTLGTSYPAARPLIEGDDIDLENDIIGIDIIEQDSVIGGQAYDAGTLLVTLAGEDNDGLGTNAQLVDRQDIAALSVLRTTLGSGAGNAQVSANLLFDGDHISDNDVNFDSGQESIDALSLTRDVSSVNVAPVLGNNSLVIDEAATVTITTAMLSATDADNADPGLVFNLGAVSGGQFELTTNPGVAVFGFTQGQVLSNEVVFVDDGDETAPSFDISVSDGTDTTAVVAGGVNFTNVNDAPTATNLSSTSSYNEGDASVPITDIVVSDIDAGDIITATLTLADTATGSLSANDGATYDGLTGIWTLTDTVANVNTALANLVFNPTLNNEVDTTIGVDIDDGDEDGSGALTGTITLDVTPINDPPTATNLTSTSAYNEGDASVPITDIVVSDIDAGDIITATLTLADTATGSLSANDGATYDGLTGIWTLTDTVANVNTALANLVFNPTLNNEVDTTIGVDIDDGDEDGSGALTGTITLDVTPINDPPTATNLTSTSAYNEGDASVPITDIVVSDIDAGDIITATLTLADTATGSLSANDGATYDGLTGIWTLTDTVANVNTALANLVFNPTLNNEVDTTIGVDIDDGDEDGSGALTGTITLDVTPINDPPTATNLTSTSAYNEGDASVPITDIVVSDIDAGDIITATLTLADTATGSLSANDGATYDGLTGIWTLTDTVANVNTALANLVFNPTLNNEVDTTIGVDIDDGDEDGSGALTGTITLDVTPINDPPTATNLTSTSAYNEGDASVPITDIVVSDIDAGDIITATLTLADTATGSLSANDGATYDGLTGIWTLTDTVANVNTALANLVFNPTLNNEVDTTIGVDIDDGDEDGSGALTGTITLDVTPINDPPTATNLTSTSAYNEGDASVPITDIVVTDVDAGDIITATLTLADTATGSLSANDGASYDGLTGIWTLTDTVANVNTALANLVFTPNITNDADTSISVTIDDGDEDGSGALTGTITLDVTPINDAPTATNLSSTSAYNEGDATVAITDIVVSDVDTGEVITATLTLADTATGSLSANDGASYDGLTGIWTLTDTVANVNTALANLVFNPNVNNDVDTSIAVDIDDGDEDGSGALTGTITLDVTPINDAPTATNLSSTSAYNEGDASLPLNDIVITDVDSGETVTATLTLVDTGTGSLSANDGASYNATTGVWTITGTVAQVNTALANLEFVPVATNTLDSAVTVSIDDGDEDTSGPLLGAMTITVTPLPVVEPPVVEPPVVEPPVEEPPADETPPDEPESEDPVEEPDVDVAGVDPEAPAGDPVLITAIEAPAPGLLPDTAVEIEEPQARDYDNDNDKVRETTILKPAGVETLITRLTEQLDFFDDPLQLIGAESFITRLNDMRQELISETEETDKVVGSSLTVTAGLSVGYVVWLARSGILLSSVLSSLPAWRFIDPLPVLGGLQGSRDGEDEESLESMVEEKEVDGERPGQQESHDGND